MAQTSEDSILSAGGRSGTLFSGGQPASRRPAHHAPPCRWAQAGDGAWRRASAGRPGSCNAAHRGVPRPAATGHGGSAAGTGPRQTPGPGGPRRHPAQTRSRRRRRDLRGLSAAPVPPRIRHRSSSGRNAARLLRPRRQLPWQQLRAGLDSVALFPKRSADPLPLVLNLGRLANWLARPETTATDGRPTVASWCSPNQ